MECLQLTTTYLSTNLEGGGNIKTLIWIGKFFETEWPDPVGPNPAAMKAVLQAKFRMRAKRVEKLRINLSKAYVIVLGQCTNYLRSRLEGQKKWEATTNERDLLGLIKIIQSFSQKYDEDTEYHHVASHTVLHCFMLFCHRNNRNLE